MAGNREMGSLRSSGDSIEGDRTLVRARSLRSDRAPARTPSLHGDRAPARARSLRSDRAEWTFGRYNDGLHRKKEWDEGIEEETKKLTRKVDDHELKIRSLYSTEDRLSRLEEDEKKNAEEIEDLKYFLKNRYPKEFY
ncbi:hypothetical protein DY000_02016742 [Brassica cretica]|uniref:Uncharacterized protein n=1 Tax=Brassica cretica TaxID=69181 RepID=A0ABQ7CWM2_BRACR|nr:hypothetical protein DY000_02016742 [Brassica cretica]